MTPQLTYFKVTVPASGKVLGVFREVRDDDTQELTLERYTRGDWTDDPTLIDELREPGVVAIDRAEAESLLPALI